MGVVDDGEGEKGPCPLRGHETAQYQLRGMQSDATGVPPKPLQPQLTVRSEAYEFERLGIRLAVDENEVRPDVAVAVIGPFTGQRVVEVTPGQRFVGNEQVHDRHQRGIEALAMPPRFLAFVVTLEAPGVANLPHSDSRGDFPVCPP